MHTRTTSKREYIQRTVYGNVLLLMCEIHPNDIIRHNAQQTITYVLRRTLAVHMSYATLIIVSE
jgi:hypothetical protein